MSKRLLYAFGLRPRPKGNIRSLNTTPLSNGLFNLPLELWLEIFAHATALSISTRSIPTELQDAQSTYHTLSHDKSVISDVHTSQKRARFAIRRNIVLVCKAWYQLGISTLYSHLRIDMDRDPKELKSLYKSVQRHPSLASSVIRLSIMNSGLYGYNVLHDRLKGQILAKMFPLLVNVRIVVTLPWLIRDFYSTLHPDIVIMDQDDEIHPDSVPKIFTRALKFASQAQTLSLMYRIYHYCEYPPDFNPVTSFPSLEFPNLVNLQIHFGPLAPYEMDKFVMNGWSLPRLRTLSIMPDNSHGWIDFIRRHAENLEALDVTPSSRWQMDSSRPMERIQLPELIKLCIYVSVSIQNQQQNTFYINLFHAPRLVQLCYQIGCISDWFFPPYPFTKQRHYYLKGLGDRAREMWPTMRELTLAYWVETARSKETIKSLNWLVGGWVEDGITVKMKYRQRTELVFPRKSDGGIAAMMEYR